MAEMKTETAAPPETLGSLPQEASSVVVHGVSAPIAPDKGWMSHIVDLNKHIFDDFYNVFRFIGYIAETFHSELKDKLKGRTLWGVKLEDTENPRFKNAILAPDIIKSKSRFIINAVEAVAFEAAGLWALIRDRNRFRKDISSVIAAETGEQKPALSIKDVMQSENPLIQSATNRLKSLYTLRLTQPLTFLYSLKLGVVSTVLEIISERTAYMERNSYDRLQRLCKDIKSNQYGTWSRDSVVEQLISIMQQNRLEHDSSPIATADIQHYMPLIQKIADRMLDKQWGMPEGVFILGQIVKEPAALAKAEQTYDDVLKHTLQGVAQIKISGRQSVINTASSVGSEDNAPSEQPAFVRDIIERGPKTAALLTQTSAPDNTAVSMRIAG